MSKYNNNCNVQSAILPLRKLTARQHEVLSLIACGYTDHMISKELGMRPLTSSQHVRVILERLGMRSRQAAARLVYAIGARWLERIPLLLAWRDADRVRLLERCLVLEAEVVQLRAIVAQLQTREA